MSANTNFLDASPSPSLLERSPSPVQSPSNLAQLVIPPSFRPVTDYGPPSCYSCALYSSLETSTALVITATSRRHAISSSRRSTPTSGRIGQRPSNSTSTLSGPTLWVHRLTLAPQKLARLLPHGPQVFVSEGRGGDPPLDPFAVSGSRQRADGFAYPVHPQMKRTPS